MTLWITLAVNSIALGGLLFLLSAGFSLIFGLMRIPNLMHGSFFMLGAYFGVSLLNHQVNFWVAALASGAAMAVIGAAIERLLLRRLAGQELAQVLLTLDRVDFRELLGGSFYGLTVLLPSDFLERERSAGRLQ